MLLTNEKKHKSNSRTEKNIIARMVDMFAEYDLIKAKKHEKYSMVQELFDARGVARSNFHKYRGRYLDSRRDPNSLIPHKTGRKYKQVLQYTPGVIEEIGKLRPKGLNRFDISTILGTLNYQISPSTAYRLMCKLRVNKLNVKIKEEKRRIIKMNAGELAHLDIHYVAKGTVKGVTERLYLLGLIDDYSRICWVEVIHSIKALDVMFSTLELLMRLKDRYNIKFKELMTDNGSEFSGRTNVDNHPVERMLKFYDIKHIYTKPYRPQTNGKIERFWKTMEDELLDGETFESLEEFETHVLGYVIYYNEHRNHQGINNKTPKSQLANEKIQNGALLKEKK